MRKLFLYIVLCSICSATVINIPTDYPTIQEGLDNARERDSLMVAAGIYVENIIWPGTYGIKLIGSGQA